MIRLDIQPYCDCCCDFEPDVAKPEKYRDSGLNVYQTDTVVRCKYAKRCESIKRYLERKAQQEKTL